MKLRTRSIRFILIVTSIFFVVSLGLSLQVTNYRLSLLDHQRMEKYAEMAKQLIQQQINSLGEHTGDYGKWDDSYRFIQNGNHSFTYGNFSDLEGTLKNLNANFILFSKLNGETVYAKAVDLEEKREIPFSESLTKAFREYGVLSHHHANPYSVNSGIIRIGDQAMLYASRGIFRSTGTGESKGYVTFARILDQRELNKIAEVLGVPFVIGKPNDLPVGADKTDSTFFQPPSDKKVHGLLLLKDVKGHFATVLKFEDLPLKNQFDTSVIFMLIAVSLLMGFFVAIAFYLVFENLVLRRLGTINNFISQLEDLRNPSLRLPPEGEDELSRLVVLLNRLLDKVVNHADEIEKKSRQVLLSHKLASLGTLAGGIAHEVNNPLTTILTGASLIGRHLEKNGAPPQYLELVKEQKNAVERIAGIVNNLSHYAKSGPTKKGLVDLHSLIRDTVSLYQGTFEKKAIQVHLELHSEKPSIFGNSSKIQLVLMNLLSNAQEALDDKNGERWIKIETADESNTLIVKIGDNGSGVDPEHMPKLFELFFSTKSNSQGAGLGLAMSRAILESMSGTIRAESVPSQGTTLVLTLPQEQPFTGAGI